MVSSVFLLPTYSSHSALDIRPSWARCWCWDDGDRKNSRLFPDFYYLRHLVLLSGPEKLKDVQKLRGRKTTPQPCWEVLLCPSSYSQGRVSGPFNGPQTKEEGRSPWRSTGPDFRVSEGVLEGPLVQTSGSRFWSQLRNQDPTSLAAKPKITLKNFN